MKRKEFITISFTALLLKACNQNSIKIWNYLSNQLSRTLETPSAVGCLAINLRANYLGAAINYSRQVKVIVWNLRGCLKSLIYYLPRRL